MGCIWQSTGSVYRKPVEEGLGPPRGHLQSELGEWVIAAKMRVMGRNGFSGQILESWEGRGMGEAGQAGLQDLWARASALPRRRVGRDVLGASESLRIAECRIPTSGVKTCLPVFAVFPPNSHRHRPHRFKFTCLTPDRWKTGQLTNAESLDHWCPVRF